MDDLDVEEQSQLAAAIAWLDSAGPDDRHRAALDFDWGGPLYLIDWIVRQPDCDVATALTVFWAGEPVSWMIEERSNTEKPNGYSYLNRQICAYIADRIRAGGYTRSRIGFAPDGFRRKDYVDLVALEKSLTKPNFGTHRDLIRRRLGRSVKNDASFYRRYPEEMHQSCYFDNGDLADTPRSIALMTHVKRIEQATLQLLPSWLRS